MILCREVIRQFHYKLLLSSKIAKAEAVVVEPVKRKMSKFVWFKLTSNRDFNRENFFSLSAALPYDPFRSMANNWHQYCKLIFYLHPFCTQRLNSLPSKSINFYVFFLSISLECCYHIDIATVATSCFLRTGGNWWLVGFIFGNLGWKNTRPLRACDYASTRQRFRTVHTTGYKPVQDRAWTLSQIMYFW